MLRLTSRARGAGRCARTSTPRTSFCSTWHACVVNATGGAGPDAWRRVVALLIQSLEAPARGPLPASSPHDDLHKATHRAGLTTPEPDTTS
ncbi:hypothetical protein [Streptomyces sp. SAI-127]|uniref:hypothetical protein n=1 Tax=Streptomyces sp. SAI-127 TaxID=2940543 RepID=UPI0024751806|nr:hypothetical protein [Streptomyces sp. SAI-127]MDH6484934.1 hypothetical protein [Streptomyces sp. SAI-127]